MRKALALLFASFVIGFVAPLPGAHVSAAVDHWVATWAAAPQLPPAPRRGGPPPASPAGAPATGAQAPTSAAAAAPPPTSPASTTATSGAPVTAVAVPQAGPAPGAFKDQTIRMFMRTSLGGRRVRVQFSNAFGAAPLVLGSAHIALHAKDSAIVSGSDHALTFGGRPSIKIPTGATVVSDPVDFNLAPLADVAISVYVPGDTGPATRHSMALRTGYVAPGDATAAVELPSGTTTSNWILVSSVDVLAPDNAATIVTLGDSITDGATSTANTNRSWPSVLAERLQANRDTRHLAVANLGISGNRVLSDGSGVSALARFDRDVLSQAGVKYLMILEGINDINGSRALPITADDLIVAMKQMIERAHSHGIKVIGCTLTPAAAATPEIAAMRLAVNDFIRKSGAFDAVVDFEAAVRDPANPAEFKKEFNNGDRLHPNDAGYKAMADAIDLKIFRRGGS